MLALGNNGEESGAVRGNLLCGLVINGLLRIVNVGIRDIAPRLLGACNK